MTKKYALLKFFFGFTVLAALVLQSGHALHHLQEAFSKKHCHHEKTPNKAELTHSHENESCFVCSFTLAQHNGLTIPVFSFASLQINCKNSFTSSQNHITGFTGSQTAPRAPPGLTSNS